MRTDSQRVLLIGDARMAFPVTKALARAGHRVYAGVSRYSNYLEWSRYLGGSFRHASLEPGTDEALPAILGWLAENGPVDAIQPVSEAGLRFLTRHRDRFEAQAALVMPSREAVATASDKSAMFALCERLGVPLAVHRTVTGLASLADAIDAIGYPLIIKPSSVDAPLHGRKALILRRPEDLARAFPAWPQEHRDLIVQAYVTGPRHSVVFTADRGRLVGAVEVCAARTHEHDGTGYTTYGITVTPTPELQAATEAMVEALGYSTTGCAQFIVDPNSDRRTFMELNPRVSLARIAECAGLSHSVWGLDIALGRTVSGRADPWDYPAGVEYVWTKGDLSLTLSLVKQRRIGALGAARRTSQIAADAVRCHHAIFDPGDPMPAMGVYLNKFIAPLRA